VARPPASAEAQGYSPGPEDAIAARGATHAAEEE